MHPTVKTARLAGLIYLSMIVVAPFCVLYIPGKLIVRGNAAATAENSLAHETMFRMSIFGDLIGQVIFICLGVVLYRLLRDTNKTWALLMLAFVVASAAVCSVNVLNDVAALILFRGNDFLVAIDKPQRDALAMFFLRLYGHGQFMAEIFWGLWLFPLGLLVYRSGLIPFHRRLADDQLLWLDRTKLHRAVLSGILQRAVRLFAAGAVWRNGPNALAADQGREIAPSGSTSVLKDEANAEYRTPNVQHRMKEVFFCNSVFGVRCSAFDVSD